jgi:uncharacterized SAM-binding protein YcdF (DUF218 family)
MLIVTKAVGILLTPPGIIVLLAILGLVLQKRSRLLGTTLLWVGIGALYALSLPVTGSALLRTLQRSAIALPTVEKIQAGDVDAIVVLGGGRDADQPQYGGDIVGRFTLERLRYAARLQRATGLPILVSGGSVFGPGVSEAELMRQTLQEDFHATSEWIEDRSHTTMENALNSRTILEAAGKKKVWLVTDAWHMPRAYWAFRRVGIETAMAPTGFIGEGTDTLLDFLPSSHGLSWSDIAIHETLGILWYRWHYGGDAKSEPKPGPGQGKQQKP